MTMPGFGEQRCPSSAHLTLYLPSVYRRSGHQDLCFSLSRPCPPPSLDRGCFTESPWHTGHVCRLPSVLLGGFNHNLSELPCLFLISSDALPLQQSFFITTLADLLWFLIYLCMLNYTKICPTQKGDQVLCKPFFCIFRTLSREFYMLYSWTFAFSPICLSH